MIKRLEIGTSMSEVTVHNGTVYLAGQVATDSSEDIHGGGANFDEVAATMAPVDS